MRNRGLQTAIVTGFSVFALVVGWFYFTGANRGAINAALAATVAAILPGSMAGSRLGQVLGVLGTTGIVMGLGAGLSLLASRRRGEGQKALLAVAVAAVVLLAGGLIVPGLRSRVVTLVEAAVLFFAAISLGCFLLEKLRFRPASGAEGLALGGALGLGAMATGFFLLGQVGLFRGWVLGIATVAVLPLGLKPVGNLAERFFSTAGRTLRGAGLLGCTLLVIVLILYVVRLLHCFSPPTMGPADYDALEYHLAAPLEWLRGGFVSFLPHNAYANMPAAAEMLYAPGLALAPGRWGGFHFARLIGLGCSELAALAVFAGARRLAGRRAALLAAVIFFAGTWLADLTVSPYVEPVLLLFVIASWTALSAATSRGRFDLFRMRTVGLLAGAACAAKYPALVLVAAPLALAVLAAGLALRQKPAKALTAAVAVGITALAVAGPWYLRNWISGGNPVYPLAGSVFSSPYWDGKKNERWKKEHSPKLSPARALWNVAAGREGRGATWENVRSGPLLVVFLPLAVWGAWRRRRRGAVWIALLPVVFIALWASATHQVERFLFPAYGGLALLAAIGAAELPRRYAGNLAAGAVLLGAMACAPAQYWYVRRARTPSRMPSPPYALMLGLEDAQRSGYLTHGYWAVVKEVDALPEGSRVMLVGEARSALFSVPTVYATVWDTHPLSVVLKSSTNAPEAADRLRKMGVTHIFWAWPEHRRLEKSYGDYLALDPAGRERLRELERGSMRRAGAWGGSCGKSPLTGRPIDLVELWELKPASDKQ